MTAPEHPALTALRETCDFFEDAASDSLPGMAYRRCLAAIPALEALLREHAEWGCAAAQRDELLAALERIANLFANGPLDAIDATHEMGAVARAAIAKAKEQA